jgi:phage terminase small subunit
MSDIPTPKDPRHQRFADLILAGKSQSEAYIEAGFKVTKKGTAATAASRARKRKDVTSYIQAIQAKTAGESVLSLQEKREFLARIVRTPLSKIDGECHETSDLIKSHASSESELSSSNRIEKLDPLKAIEVDTKLAGDDPAANALADIAKSLGMLGASTPLPTDSM